MSATPPARATRLTAREERPVTRSERSTLLRVAAAAIVMVAIDFGRRILATNDEARFAMLAHDMLSRGAWMFPQLNGVAYNAKPPMLAWLIALASWPGGQVTQVTAALPSALAAVGTALVVFAAGRGAFGSTAGWFAALATVSTQGWFLHARLPMPDMLVTFCITLAVAFLWPIAQGRPGHWWLGFWLSMVTAFWTKGAAALLPLVVAVSWGLLARPAGWWRALRPGPGLALFAALVAPWWIGKLWTQSEAMREVVVADNLMWYLPRTFAVLLGPPQHLVGILFPWVLVLPLAAWRAAIAIKRREPERTALAFVIVWSLVLLVCLGISEQQRLRYYLPIVSPAALLIGWWGARAVGRAVDDTRVPWRVYAVVGLVLALATAAAALARPSWIHRAHVAFPTSTREIAVMAVGIGLMVVVLGYGVRRGQVRRVFALACLGSAAWVAGWYHWELERSNAAYDYPRVRSEVRRLLPEDPVVATWGVYDLPMSFYLGQPVLPVHSRGDLDRIMAGHPRGSAVLTEAALAEVPDRARLRVLPLDRLNFDSIVLVSPRAGVQP